MQCFKRAMEAATRIFGPLAFRKPGEGRVNPISKPLFETWGVQLARCSREQVDLLVGQRDDVQNRFAVILNENPEFDKAISLSTGMRRRIRKRFQVVRDLIQGFV